MPLLRTDSQIDNSSQILQRVLDTFNSLPCPDSISSEQCGLCETCQHDPLAHSQCDKTAPKTHDYTKWHNHVNGLVYLATDENVAVLMPQLKIKAIVELSMVWFPPSAPHEFIIPLNSFPNILMRRTIPPPGFDD